VNGDGCLDKADAYRDYVARGKRVNAFQAEEFQRLSGSDRLRQFLALRALARKMGWETSTPAEVDEVRARWRRLRETYLAKNAH
jgi:hypothetical protein